MVGVAATPRGSFWLQVAVLARKLFYELVSQPLPLVGALLFTPAFLILQDGLLGGSTAIVESVGGDYFAFIVPAGVLIATINSGIGAFVLVRDREDHYLHRLLTMPLSRTAIVAAPLAFGACYAALNSAVVLLVAALLGATPTTGAAGAIAMSAIAACWGLGFAGLLVAIALVTDSVEHLQLANIGLFALLFASPVVVPRHELKGWVQALADANPFTYALEGTRSLMLDGWHAGQLGAAALASIAVAAAMLVAAVVAMRWASARP